MACTSWLNVNELDAADKTSTGLKREGVAALAAVAEVLIERPASGVFALSTSPRRRLAPINGETAPDRTSLGAAVSAMCIAVGVEAPSGATRFKLHTGVMAVTVMLQVPLRSRIF